MAKATKRENLNIFAKRLGELIKENGYTHENVAQGIEVTRQGVGKWVSGESVPDVLTAAKLADFLNVSVDYLAGVSNVKSNNPNIQSVCDFLEIDEQAVDGLLKIKNQINSLNFRFDKEQYGICMPLVTGDYFKKCIGYFLENEIQNLITSLIQSYIDLCNYEPTAKMFDSDVEETDIESIEMKQKCWDARDKVDLIKYRNSSRCLEIIDRFYNFLKKDNNCINSHVEYFNNINPDLQTGHRHGIIIAKTKDVPNHVKEGEVKQK